MILVLIVIALCLLYLGLVIRGFRRAGQEEAPTIPLHTSTPEHLSESVAAAVRAGGIRPAMAVPRKRPAIQTRSTRTL